MSQFQTLSELRILRHAQALDLCACTEHSRASLQQKCKGFVQCLSLHAQSNLQ